MSRGESGWIVFVRGDGFPNRVGTSDLYNQGSCIGLLGGLRLVPE